MSWIGDEIMSVQGDEVRQLQNNHYSEIHQQLEAQVEEQTRIEQAEVAAERESVELEMAMRAILTPDARDRLARVEMAFPELATMVKKHLMTLQSTGQLAGSVDDSTLKRILQGLSDSTRRETTIRRI